jgi:hypothetical protein
VPVLLDRSDRGSGLPGDSGDFNDWTRKVASTHDARSFMFLHKHLAWPKQP